ncbi:hypothetical protein ABZT49_32775 [Methylobacterium sp. EM32]|uniref:hypothetical protein n=1 Tax=Methylobacterium sp. EM32 TaxID=3163481 RepID=UPI0033B9B06D
MVQYDGLIPTAQFWIFIDENNTVGMSYHTRVSKTIVTLSCTFDTNIFDGNWHQASVRMTSTKQSNVVAIYLDGMLTNVEGQPQQQIVPTNFNFTGMINIGHNAVISLLSPAPFLGDVTEIRLWGDSGSFLPRPSNPLSPGTSGLDNYWPFWTNYEKGTNLDVCAATGAAPATFSNCSLGFVSPLIYDPWNDAILNAQTQSFPPFTDGQQSAAAQDIIAQLVTMRDLEVKSPSVAALRALYTNPVVIVPSAIPVGLSMVTPSKSDADYKADFEFVRHQLLNEVGTVQMIYQFQQQVTNFTSVYYNYMNSAFNAIVVADFTPVDITMNVDISQGLAVAEALLELLMSAAPTERKGRAVELSDESIASGISLVCSLIDFLTVGDQVQSQPNTVLSTTLENINSEIIAEFTRRLGFVNTNAQSIIQDWGKLSVINENSGDFYFNYAFSTAAGQAIYMNNLVSFTKSILTAQYTIWEIQAVETTEIQYLDWNGTDVLNPALTRFLPNSMYPNMWNFYAICNYNAYPSIVSFTNAPSQSASNFLFNQCQLTLDDVFNWPFPSNCCNPF